MGAKHKEAGGQTWNDYYKAIPPADRTSEEFGEFRARCALCGEWSAATSPAAIQGAMDDHLAFVHGIVTALARELVDKG